MNTFDIESKMNSILCDAKSIQTLTTEVSENLKPNCPDYFKLHAAYELAENQIKLIEEVEERLVKIREEVQ